MLHDLHKKALRPSARILPKNKAHYENSFLDTAFIPLLSPDDVASIRNKTGNVPITLH